MRATPAVPAKLTGKGPTDNPTRVSYSLPSALELRQALPLTADLAANIEQQRQAVRNILQGHDQRLLVVIGPCSIHDTQAALEYADKLAQLSQQVSDQFLLAMRIYIEKPRTTVGWKGLLYDPFLDNSCDMASGLQISRQLMLQVAELGLPVASELLQPLAAHYFTDILSWAAIGARTSESQIHRELVSSLSLPVGFKNGTDGSVQIAIDAMGSAAYGHQFMGVNSQGEVALLQAAGNQDCHLVLRGGQGGPNYDWQSQRQAATALEQSGVNPGLMVDCSHANSGKDPLQQPQIVEQLIEQKAQGNRYLRALMIESHLFDGAQSLGQNMAYGVSVTDGCLGWDKTERMLLRAATLLRKQQAG